MREEKYTRREHTVRNHKTVMRQRRLAVLALTLLVIVFMFGLVRSVSAMETKTYTKYVTCVTIESGDSLWSIAEEHITDGYHSIPELVEEIKNANHLYTDEIHTGEKLIVPYYVVCNDAD